jgi:hypothetical protein
MADAAADGRQGVFFLDELEGLPILALGGQGHIPLDRDVRRTGGFTRRGAAFFNGVSPGDCLSVLAKGSLAVIETLVVFIFAFHGTNFGAFAAAGALGRVYIAGLLQNLYGEVSRLTGNLLNFG